MNNMKKPKIRFKGFTDDWEQRKLGDVVERITRKNQDLESTLPLTISAQYGLIDQNEFFDKRIASKDVSGYYLVRKGEFAYNKSTSSDAPWGAIKRLDRYESGVLSTLYIVFRILDESQTDSDYLLSYYDTDLWHKDVQAIAAEGARNHGLLNIAPADFFETTLMLPQDIEEQRLIGRYFMHLDKLITLHQRKYEKLQIIKKSMLENCFPKNGEKVPKIRFSGFTGDWEQRKLGELGKARSGIGFPDAEQGGKEGVPFYKVSDMNNVGNEHEMVAANNHVTREQIARKGWKPIDEVPAIFFAKVGAAVLLNRKRLCRFPFLLDNNTMAYSIDGSALDADFAITLFDTIDLTSLVQAGALPSYNSGDVEDIDVVIPEMSEQRKIGTYFKRIDSLITLHQSELEKLQKIKKSLLERMFV